MYDKDKSICSCGHTGDSSSEDGRHIGLQGHGACTVHDCPCRQFTWVGWTPKYQADMVKNEDKIAAATAALRLDIDSSSSQPKDREFDYMPSVVFVASSEPHSFTVQMDDGHSYKVEITLAKP